MISIKCSKTDIFKKQYVFDFIFEDMEYDLHFEDQYDSYEIKYNDKTIQLPDYFFKDYYQKDSSIEFKSNWSIESFPDYHIPLLFGTGNSFSSNGSTLYDIDLIGTIFYFLSGYSEQSVKERDDHNRLQLKSTPIYKFGYYTTPVVDIVAAIIRDILGMEPKNYRRDIVLTHDIDQLNKYETPIKTMVGDLVKRKDFKLFLSTLMGSLGCKLFLRKDPWDRFRSYIDIAKKYDLEQIFFIISSEDSKHDNNYSLESSRINRIIKQISDSSTIGIHYGYGSVFDKKIDDDIIKLRTFLDKPIYLGRSHFLRFDYNTLLTSLENTPITTDYSLGFSESWGFRNGTFKTYYGWDHENGCRSAQLLAPLHIMDTTFTTYGCDKFKESLKTLLDLHTKFGGSLNILLHNSCVTDFSKDLDEVLYQYY